MNFFSFPEAVIDEGIHGEIDDDHLWTKLHDAPTIPGTPHFLSPLLVEMIEDERFELQIEKFM